MRASATAGDPATEPESAITWLQQYDFPGNVRELQNLMERAVLLANGRPVEPCHFLLENEDWPLFDEESPAPATSASSSAMTSAAQEALAMATASAPAAGGDASSADYSSLAGAAGPAAEGRMQGAVIPLHEMERIMILMGLEVTSGNRTQAADLLGISVRTLRNKLNEYRAAGHPID